MKRQKTISFDKLKCVKIQCLATEGSSSFSKNFHRDIFLDIICVIVTVVVQEVYFEMIKMKPSLLGHVMLYTDADKLIVDYCFKLFT